MEANPSLPRELADFLDRLAGADLVVGVHNADQDRLRSNGAAHVPRIDPARAIDWMVSDRSAQPFEKSTGSKNSGMLDRRGDDVRPFMVQREERALDCQIVCFAAAAGENDLVGRAPISAATWPRACSRAAFAGMLAQWPLDGLPNSSSRNGRIAAATAGSMDVLAL